MILYVKNANFAGNNIGQLDTLFVYKKIGGGTVHDIPNTVTSGVNYEWIIEVVDGYAFDEEGISITMGSDDNNIPYEIIEDGKKLRINTGEVNGGITIEVPTTENEEV